MLSAHEKYLNTFRYQLGEITKQGYNFNDLRSEERDKIVKTNILRPARLRTKKMDYVWGCTECKWRGDRKEAKRDVSTDVVRYVCPDCGGEMMSKGNRPDDKSIKKALSDYCDLMNILRPYHAKVVEDPNSGKVALVPNPLPPLKLTIDNVIDANYITCDSTIPNTRITRGMKLIGVVFQTKSPERDGGQKFWRFV